MTPVDYSVGALPWLFLGIGAVLGLVLTWRLLRSPSGTEPSPDADLRLLRTDLEKQKASLLARLRGDSMEELGDDDRRQLELDAARVMQRLDELPAVAAPSAASPSPSTKSSASTVAAGQPTGFWARHPALAGALLGGGAVALVSALVWFAIRDEGPRPDGMMAPAPPPANAAGSASGGAPGQSSQPPLPPFLQQQVDGMRAELAANPDDLDLRKNLALTLLSGEQFFDAFQEANLILQTSPDDPQALYVSGFVRFIMGQSSDAIDQFDRAIESDATYSQPWLVKGLIQLQLQDREAAIETWQAGDLASGGSDARLARLIRDAQSGKSVEEILSAPPPE